MPKNYMFLAIALALVFSLFSCGPSPEVTPTSQSEEGEARELDIETQTIAVLVDENTYHQVTLEIERYVKDIENDLKANVFLYHRNWQNPREVRNQLLSLKSRNLKGAVLIGEIPAVYFEWEENSVPPCWAINANIKEYPSDRYYMDLENKLFIDRDSDGKFDDDSYSVSKEPVKLIWVGRIKSPVGGTEGINLLRNYFERNHQYRTGESQNKRMLVYSQKVPDLPPPMIQEGEKMVEGKPFILTLEKHLENMRNALTGFGFSQPLYSQDEIDILVGPSRDEYLKALQKNYEIVSLCIHGSSTAQFFKDGPITVEDIKTTQPQPYFYFLFSCFNGDFTKENYLGGHYLFNGNGLAVWTITVPGLHGETDAHPYLTVLSFGQTFGEAFIFGGSYVEKQAILLGDPTLRIRSQTGNARVVVETTEIDFGKVKTDFGKFLEEHKKDPIPPEDPLKNFVREEVIGEVGMTVKNIGNEVAVFSIWGGGMRNENDTPAKSLCDYYNEISPGESKIFKFTFIPNEKGDYAGFTTINTNDPDNPVIIIKLRGRGI